MIDLHDLIEQKSPVRLTKVASSHNGEWAGNCPWCSGTDRFRVWPFSTRSHYWCRGCNKTGDAIQFLRDYCDMSFISACQELGIEPGDTISHEAPMFFDEDAPCAKWQEMANLVVKSAENYLWSNKAPHALEYLMKRGLNEETIRRARLGYVPLMPDGTWYQRSFADWGLTDEMLSEKQKTKGGVKIPPGILIPWYADQQIWKLAIKRFEAKDGEMSYGQIVGSKDALYNADSLARGKPSLLVEGEFDVLSAEQEARDLVATIGTGSTAKARIPLWIARMASTASFVLVSFDNDENSAGDNAAAFWLETLPKSMRWLPYAHDINDMLKEGKSIRQWVQLGLSLAMEEKPTEQPLQGIQQEEPFICSKCGLDLNNPDIDAHIDPQGVSYCEACWKKQQTPVAEPPAEPATPFYPCSKCGKDTMRHEPDGLCSQCHWETLTQYYPPQTLQNTWTSSRK